MKTAVKSFLFAGLSGLFGIYIIFQLANCFLGKPRKEKRIKEICVAAGFAAIMAGHSLPGGFFTAVAGYAAAVLIVAKAYNGGRTSKILYAAYGILIMVGIQALLVVMQQQDPQEARFNRQLLAYIVEYIAAVMLKRINLTQREIPVPKIYWAYVVVVPISSMYVIYLLYKVGSLSVMEIFLAAAAVLGVDYIIILLYDALMEAYQRSLRQSMLERQNLYYANQLQMMSEAYDTIRSVKHDISKSLNAIRYLAQKNECGRIIDYVDSVNEAPGFNANYIDTGNGAIDNILNYKQQEAEKAGVEISCSAAVGSDAQLNEFDMAILLGNLLDNAVTAAAEAESGKTVQVMIRQTADAVLINVENPYSHELVYNRSHKLVSTRPDAREHGIGLENVSRIVKKYEGTIDIYSENNIFKVKIKIFPDFA